MKGVGPCLNESESPFQMCPALWLLWTLSAPGAPFTLLSLEDQDQNLLVLLGEPLSKTAHPAKAPYSDHLHQSRNAKLTSYHQLEDFEEGWKEIGDISPHVLPTPESFSIGIHLKLSDGHTTWEDPRSE